MRISVSMFLIAACGAAPSASASQALLDSGLTKWPQHSMDRPKPPTITLGAIKTDQPVPPSSDAIVLFDGKDLSKWTDGSNSAKWKVAKGYMEVVAKTGNIQTKQGFGDVQLHVEWMAPVPAEGKGQERGNSGVFLMKSYELQVLDSYNNVTYADGQAGSVFGQYPPLVNVSRPPGQWQTYDVVFHRPRFDSRGSLQSPARMTVFQNGVLVQDNVTLSGPTAFQRRPPYSAHADRMPLSLQDHGHPVRYRNIWLRDLEARVR